MINIIVFSCYCWQKERGAAVNRLILEQYYLKLLAIFHFTNYHNCFMSVLVCNLYGGIFSKYFCTIFNCLHSFLSLCSAKLLIKQVDWTKWRQTTYNVQRTMNHEPWITNGQTRRLRDLYESCKSIHSLFRSRTPRRSWRRIRVCCPNVPVTLRPPEGIDWFRFFLLLNWNYRIIYKSKEGNRGVKKIVILLKIRRMIIIDYKLLRKDRDKWDRFYKGKT